MKRQTLLWLTAAVLWMALIFAMSARPAALSQEDSGRTGSFLLRTFFPHFEEMTEAEQLRLTASFEYPLRKGAHVMEYAVLSFFLGMAAISAVKTEKAVRGILRRPVMVSFAAAVLYAVSDEIHQLFVPGRSGQAKDVLIDAAGAAAAAFFVWLKYKKKHPAQQ